MAKTIKKIIKVKVKGGQANPAPPLGPALGQAGVDIGGVVEKLNEQTRKPETMGKELPVQITVYDDRSFTFIVKKPAATSLILERAKIQAGSGEPNKKKVGKITRKDLREIAEIKISDLNCVDIEAAEKS